MIKTVTFLWLASLSGAGAAFLTQVILARQLGPAEFGAFASVLAAVTVLTPLAGFGIGGFWFRAFGKEGWEGVRWVRPGLHFCLVSTLAVMGVIILWGLLGPHDGTSSLLFLLLSLHVSGYAMMDIVGARYQLEERYFCLAAWQFTPHLARLLVVGIMMISLEASFSNEFAAVAYAAVAGGLIALGSGPLARMLEADFSLRGHERAVPVSRTCILSDPRLVEVARLTLPFGLSGFFYLIYSQIGLVLLKYLGEDEQAGIFSVAFVILTAVYLLPSVIYQKYLLAKIHRWAHHDQAAFRQVYDRGNRLMAVLGTGAMLGVAGFGPPVIPYIFGSAFASSGAALVILALAIPLRFVSANVEAMLVSHENMQRKVMYMGVVAVVSVFLNLLLIPTFGVNGVALATVFSEALLLVLFVGAVRKFVFNGSKVGG